MGKNNSYRNSYLKSDHWSALRDARLVKSKCACEICGFQSQGNDVHHLKYRRLYDVDVMDIRVLCRPCHEQVHLLLEKYPGLSKLEAKPQWKTVRAHLKEIVMTLKRKHLARRNIARRLERKHQLFGKARRLLSELGLASKHKMRLRPTMITMPAFDNELQAFKKTNDPVPVLNAYEEITGMFIRMDGQCRGEH